MTRSARSRRASASYPHPKRRPWYAVVSDLQALLVLAVMRTLKDGGV
jgi:hypothetical protein